MKTILKIIAALLVILAVGVIAMALLDLCPPAGPWPLPPWCEVSPGTPAGLERAAPTASAAVEEDQDLNAALPVFRVGEQVALDASQFLSWEGTDASASWTQLFYPDRYTGTDLISSTPLAWEPAGSTGISFTPEWPGAYRFQLNLSAGDGPQGAVVDLMVQPEQPYFDLSGAAMDYWNYAESRTAAAPAIFDNLTARGFDLVMFSPSLYMPSRSSTEIAPCPLAEFDPEACRGVIADQTLIELIREAHARGLEVLVKPHLKILSGSSPEWPGYMEISDWDAWFESYGAYLLQYARLAEAEGVEHFSLGNELGYFCTSQTAHWRALIGQVREVYSGQLSYHDNSFSSEGSAVEFWDDLDYIGVNLWSPASGVFGVPESADPDLEGMIQALDGQLAKTLDPVAERFGKPVVITEFGTSNYDGSNIGFWEYNGPTDNGEQAAFYEAALRVFASRPFIKGLIVWAYDWESSTPPERLTMSPLDKPAEEMLTLWLEAP